jgi:hypothetical protein
MDIIDSLDIKKDIVRIDEAYLYIKKPERLDELPKIDYPLHKRFKIETQETILDYFEIFTKRTSDFNISVINGVYFYECNYYCYFCKSKLWDNWVYCLYGYKDMCIPCHNKISKEMCLCSENMLERNISILDEKTRFKYCGFGSMLNWIPVIHEWEDRVLINLNPDHEHYKRICLQVCDSEGRMKYSTLEKKYNLPEIVDRLNLIAYFKKIEYRTSIFKLAEELGVPTDYM